MIVAPISSLRVGLKTILAGKSGIQVVAEAAALDEPEVLPSQLDLLIVAALENPTNSWLRSLLNSFPPLPFLLLLSPPASEEALFLPPDHVMGILNINALPEDIEAAIGALAAGLSVIDPQMSHNIHFSPVSPGGMLQGDHFPLEDLEKDQDPFTEALTGRENEILQALALGLTNKEIARRFAISEHTVKYHIGSIYSKLGVNNRTEAVRQGIRLGIITI